MINLNCTLFRYPNTIFIFSTSAKQPYKNSNSGNNHCHAYNSNNKLRITKVPLFLFACLVGIKTLAYQPKHKRFFFFNLGTAEKHRKDYSFVLIQSYETDITSVLQQCYGIVKPFHLFSASNVCKISRDFSC